MKEKKERWFKNQIEKNIVCLDEGKRDNGNKRLRKE